MDDDGMPVEQPDMSGPDISAEMEASMKIMCMQIDGKYCAIDQSTMMLFGEEGPEKYIQLIPGNNITLPATERSQLVKEFCENDCVNAVSPCPAAPAPGTIPVQHGIGVLHLRLEP